MIDQPTSTISFGQIAHLKLLPTVGMSEPGWTRAGRHAQREYKPSDDQKFEDQNWGDQNWGDSGDWKRRDGKTKPHLEYAGPC